MTQLVPTSQPPLAQLGAFGQAGELVTYSRRPTSVDETKTFEALETSMGEECVNRHSLQNTLMGKASPHPETVLRLQKYAATTAGLDPTSFIVRRLFAIRHWRGPYENLLSHHVATVDEMPDEEVLGDNVLLMTAYYVLTAYLHMYPFAPLGPSARKLHLKREGRFWLVYTVVRRRLETADDSTDQVDQVDQVEYYTNRQLAPSPADVARAHRWVPWRTAIYGKVISNGLSIAKRVRLIRGLTSGQVDQWMCLYRAIQGDETIAAKTKDDMMILGAFFVSKHAPSHMDDLYVYDFVKAIQRQYRPKSLRNLWEIVFEDTSSLYNDDYDELDLLRTHLADLLERLV